MDITVEVKGIAEQYLDKVRPSGPENIMAICPFHRKEDGSQERTPSFSMSLTKGVYYCHRCHEKGTLRKFLKDMGLPHNTVQLHYSMVLEEVGKNLPPFRDHVSPKGVFTTTPMEDAVLGFFQYDVRPILPNFSLETLQHFEVGWDGWWNRITFPIRDIKGDLVALSGRAVYPEQEPRYKVYDEEYKVWEMPPRYGWNKRTVLWHMNDIYPVLAHASPGAPESYVVVVEGFKAALKVWEAGIQNVVALLGSYMSWEQEWILASLGCPVYLFLDNDNAGWRGQLNAANRLLPVIRDGRVHIIEYPDRLADEDDSQPDSLTLTELNEQKAKAPTYVKWKSALGVAKWHSERIKII